MCVSYRSQGLDHFLWLTGDRGACDWPDNDPALANVIKVVHFGWHHHAGGKSGEPKGWEGHIKNKVSEHEHVVSMLLTAFLQAHHPSMSLHVSADLA